MNLSAAVGVARLARFRATGLLVFDATPTGLLNALAPWIAFAVVGFVLMLVSGAAGTALGDLLVTLIALLSPPVLSETLARLWRRDEAWLRYAVALTWCQWVMPPALLVAIVLSGALVAGGLPDEIAELIGALALLAYALALHFFVARHALALPRWRAAALVALVNVGTGALVAAPSLLRNALDGTA